MGLPGALAECHQADRWCLLGVTRDVGGVARSVGGGFLRGGTAMVKRHDAQVLLNDSTTGPEQDGERCTLRYVLMPNGCRRSRWTVIGIGNWNGV